MPAGDPAPNLAWIANYIWGIADDVLRDLYVRGKYRDVILPMTVLRRLDAVLEATKEDVMAQKRILDDRGIAHLRWSVRHRRNAHPRRRPQRQFPFHWRCWLRREQHPPLTADNTRSGGGGRCKHAVVKEMTPHLWLAMSSKNSQKAHILPRR